MARKKSSKGTSDNVKEYHLDVAKLSLKDENRIPLLMQILEEQLPSCKVSKSGNLVKIIVPDYVSKRMVRLRIKKGLQYSQLKPVYRVISMGKEDLAGYQIVER